MSTEHHWQFFRAGGVDQVVIRTGADIANIGRLDQKLWVALACPTRGIEFDPRTLDLIDTDRDGRIRPPELIAACEWACAHVKDAEELVRGGDAIALDAIADGPRAADEAAGATPLADEARRILQLRGRPDASTIALADVTDRAELLDAMRFNGDGIVPPESADDEVERGVLRLIMKTQGHARDRNGLDGVNRALAEAFFAQARSLHDWRTGAASLGGDLGVAEGEALLAAAQSVGVVREKVDDFFALCRLVAYDPGAVAALNPSAAHYEALALRDPALRAEGIARLPLAPVRADRTLPLRHGMNPAWAEALGNLRRDAAWLQKADADADSLEEREWEALKDRVQSCQQWLAARPETKLGELSAVEVEAALAQFDAVMGLIEADERVEPHNARLADLEKLLRFKRDLLALLTNFVSFKAFYRREGAIFQAGTLYLDGRSCELSVEVADASRHAALAGLAKAYLAYCQCTRQGRTITNVSAFTAGDVDFLFVGRNGVFYDRQGHDWDATIVKVIENPTSVAQAFLSPYKKFLRMIEEQVARRAAASDTLAQDSLGSLATTLVNADKAAAAGATGATGRHGTAPAPAIASPLKLPARIDVGTVAALGVALGSISAVLVGIFAKFVDLGAWIPVAIVGIVIAISGPSMLIAGLKLRQRSLGPILDASGWAINGRMRVNVRLGGSLSQTAHLPPNSRRSLRDPYAPSNGWAGAMAALVVVAALAALAWRMDWLDTVLPAAWQHAPVAAAR